MLRFSRHLLFCGALGLMPAFGQSTLYTLDRGAAAMNPLQFFGFGEQVVGLGDVDNDGFPDLLVAAPFGSTGSTGASTSHLYSGPTGALLQDLDGGVAIGKAGDVNGDGHADMILFGDPSTLVQVISGASGQSLFPLEVFGFPFFLPAFDSVPDLDGDGRPELLATMPYDDRTGTDSGRVYVFSSQGGFVIHDIDERTQDARLGTAAQAIADVNGDGKADLLVGAPGRFGHPQSYIPRVYIFSGQDASVLHRFDGRNGLDRLGLAVAGIGDVNFDGVGDVAIGSDRQGAGGIGSGYVEVRSGASGLLLYTLESVQPNTRFGAHLAALGDINGDGAGDFLVSAASANGGHGRVNVISGIDGRTLYGIEGASTDFQLGTAIDGIGDVNGDGKGDWVVGGVDVLTSAPNVRVISGFDSIGTVSQCSMPVPNSSGRVSQVRASGSTLVADQNVTLWADGLPTGQFGYFLVGSSTGFVPLPGSQGVLCLAGNLGRYNRTAEQIQNTGPHGLMRLPLDLTALPTDPDVPVLAGQTWHFQAWHRDQNPTSTSHFTSMVSIAFQ